MRTPPPESPHDRALVGIFVGGRGRRMGGRTKGDLRAPDTGERLVARLVRVSRDAGLPCVLVGSHTEMAPLSPEVERVDDQPPDIGPLGGLRGLLRRAGEGAAIAVACDMPFVTPALLARLASSGPDAAVLAPRDRASGKWQPLFARYDPPRVLPALDGALAEGVRSFQALFARLDVTQLQLDDAERALLRDWDTPEDIF